MVNLAHYACQYDPFIRDSSGAGVQSTYLPEIYVLVTVWRRHVVVRKGHVIVNISSVSLEIFRGSERYRDASDSEVSDML